MMLPKLSNLYYLPQLPSWWWLFCPPPIYWYKLYKWYKENVFNSVSVLILGYKGSGKTTLWRQLQGVISNTDEYKTTLMYENIEGFSFECEGKLRRILKSKDFSGSDDMLGNPVFECQLSEILQKDTFIYYLIDLNKLNEESEDDILCRIEKICSIVREKLRIKDPVRIMFVGTHLNQYLSDNPDKNVHDAKVNLYNKLSRGIKDFNVDGRFMVAELTDRHHINEFYKHIMGTQ